VELKVSFNKIKSPLWAGISEHFCFKSRASEGVCKLDKRVYKRDRYNFTRKIADISDAV
jgi:hypothetical protein